MTVDPQRVRVVVDAPPHDGGRYVLYWMIAQRRRRFNPSLELAARLANERGVPLLVFEPLRLNYPWANRRIHTFVVEGMIDNERAFKKEVAYYPYVEPKRAAGKGLLAHLAKDAAIVVVDDFPCFFLPRMLKAAAAQLRKLGRRLVAVDGNGLYPMAATSRLFHRAHDFRRHLQKELPPHLGSQPVADPLAQFARGPSVEELLKQETLARWPKTRVAELLSDGFGAFDLDDAVLPGSMVGGAQAAEAHLDRFVGERLSVYGQDRNHPDTDATSHLSPYLHFGHLSVHDIFSRLVARDEWDLSRVAQKATGSRHGFWGFSESTESFLDQVVTWRELGYNRSSLQSNYDSFESLPEWAIETLADHADDERPYVYAPEQFESASTHDDIWNAAQRQLVQTGAMHNYLRMLWGKKILHWSPTPADALGTMIHLNNRYALDGRNPNSYSGIFWTLGRFDRPWGPERDVFGKVRYMTSASTRRKLRLDRYLAKYGDVGGQGNLFPAR